MSKQRLSPVQGLLETAAPRSDFEGALLALAVWLRYSAARWLTWNANYNVKPREISAAQVQHSAPGRSCCACVSLHLRNPACLLGYTALWLHKDADKTTQSGVLGFRQSIQCTHS